MISESEIKICDKCTKTKTIDKYRKYNEKSYSLLTDALTLNNIMSLYKDKYLEEETDDAK